MADELLADRGILVGQKTMSRWALTFDPVQGKHSAVETVSVDPATGALPGCR